MTGTPGIMTYEERAKQKINGLSKVLSYDQSQVTCNSRIPLTSPTNTIHTNNYIKESQNGNKQQASNIHHLLGQSPEHLEALTHYF